MKKNIVEKIPLSDVGYQLRAVFCNQYTQRCKLSHVKSFNWLQEELP